MVKFTKTHNIVKKETGLWRSIHGYGAAQLVNGRLLLCGFDVSLHLWRDAKYDAIIECNGVPFRIEVKSTGINTDPDFNESQKLTFTSGGRSGAQISRDAESREEILNIRDADFAIAVNSHDGTLWILPIEILSIIKKKDIICKFADLYREKVSIFKGIEGTTFDTQSIKNGFLNHSLEDLEELCEINKVKIQNSHKSENFDYPWQISARVSSIKLSYKESLILDIWKFILKNS